MWRGLGALGVLGLVCVAVQAEEAKPGAALKNLEVWVGDWTFEEHGKNPETGEEWASKGTGEFRKMGEHFYVWRARGEGGSFISINGYDPVKKAYFRHAFNDKGWRGTSMVTFGEGTVTDDWTGVSATGEQTPRRRCVGEFKKATWTCEDLIDGKWIAVVEGKGTYTKPE